MGGVIALVVLTLVLVSLMLAFAYRTGIRDAKKYSYSEDIGSGIDVPPFSWMDRMAAIAYRRYKRDHS